MFVLHRHDGKPDRDDGAVDLSVSTHAAGESAVSTSTEDRRRTALSLGWLSAFHAGGAGVELGASSHAAARSARPAFSTSRTRGDTSHVVRDQSNSAGQPTSPWADPKHQHATTDAADCTPFTSTT